VSYEEEEDTCRRREQVVQISHLGVCHMRRRRIHVGGGNR
jgi:hypothetical protein